MEKIKNLLSKIHLAPLIFLALSLKLLIIDITFPSAIAFLCIAGLYGYYKYLRSRVLIDINQKILVELEKMKRVVDGIKAKEQFKVADSEQKKFF